MGIVESRCSCICREFFVCVAGSVKPKNCDSLWKMKDVDGEYTFFLCVFLCGYCMCNIHVCVA